MSRVAGIRRSTASLVAWLLMLVVLVMGATAEAADATKKNEKEGQTYNDVDGAMEETGSNAPRKQLFLFAGPHRAASTSVEHFFYEWAYQAKRKKTSLFALRGFKWPRINTTALDEKFYSPEDNVEEAPYKIFNRLVTEPTNVILRNKILEGVRDTWEDATKGVIVGGEAFDMVEPYGEAKRAMQFVVDHLSVAPQDVTVILNYRVPHLDHWKSLLQARIASRRTADRSTTDSYNHNLCLDRKHNWEVVLGTAMNPLGLANEYLQMGWKVKLIDMSGVESSERDISHVIACEAIGAACIDGWMKYHEGDIPHHTNPTKEDVSAVTASMHEMLSDAQLEEIEQLFRYRDCAYQSTLEGNPNFDVVEAGSIWKDCQADKLATYQSLSSNFADVSILYKALLSQVTCPKKTAKSPFTKKQMITMDDVFSGKVVELANQKNKLTPTKIPKTTSSQRGGKGHFLQELVLFPLILFGVIGYQLNRMVKQHKRPAGSYGTIPQLEGGGGGFEMRALEGQDQADAEYGDDDDDDDWGDEEDEGNGAVVARL